MSERVIIVEMKDGKREGYVIEWGKQDSLRHFSTGEWMIFDKWKMIRTEDVKSLTLLPEEVEDEPKPFISGGYINAKALTELRADEQVINFKNIKAFEENKMHYGWDLGKIQELKDEQDKQQEERERPAKERKERELDSLVNITDEVFGFIRKYNTERIHDLKRHNELYDEIVRELERANRHKHTKG